MKAWKGYEKRKFCRIPKWKDATGYRSEKVCCIPKLVKKSPACRALPSLFRLFNSNLHKISPVKVAKHHTMATLTGLIYADFILLAE